MLAADHRALLALIEDAVAAAGPRRAALVARVAGALGRHCAAEEEHLHPLLRRTLDDGERCVQDDVEEHEQIERLLGELAGADPGSPAVPERLRDLAGAVRRHVEGVEGRRLPPLRQRTTVTELHERARAARAVLDPAGAHG